MSTPEDTLSIPASNGSASLGEWRTDSAGRDYIAAKGRSGIIYRQGEETIEQALERDAAAEKDKKPQRKKAPARKPPAPTQHSLKELEHQLAEALAMPAMPCAMFGDIWAANHFTAQGPVFARQLVAAAEHNRWLRSKLEELMSDEELASKILAMMGIAGAGLAYLIPPLIYWFNLPVPPQARAMFGIPDIQVQPPPSGESEDAAAAPAAPPAAAAAA